MSRCALRSVNYGRRVHSALDVISVRVEEEHLSDTGVWNVAGDVLDAVFVQQAFHGVDVGHSESDVVDSRLDFGVGRVGVFRFDQVNLQAVVEQPRSAKVEAGSLQRFETKHVAVEADALFEVACDSGNVVDVFNRQRVRHYSVLGARCRIRL